MIIKKCILEQLGEIVTKVEITKFGVIHVHAHCESCDWSGDGDMSPKEFKAAAKKHTRETGHTTIIETGDSTEYRLIKND